MPNQLDLPGMGFPTNTNSASLLVFDPVLTIRPKSAADIDDDLFSEADMTWLMTSGASDDVHFNEPLASPVYDSLRPPHTAASLGRVPGNAGTDLALPELGAWMMPQLQFPHSIAAAASASPIQLVSLRSTASSPAQGLSSNTTTAQGTVVSSDVWHRQPPLQPVPVRGTYPCLAQLDTQSTLMSELFLPQDPSKLVGAPPLPHHSKHPSVIKQTAARSQEPASASVHSPTLRHAALSPASAHAASDQHTQQLGQLQPSFAQLPANDSPALSSCLLELQALAATRTRAQKPRESYCPSNLHPTLISHLDSHALLSYGSIEDSFEFTRDLGMHQPESLTSATDGKNILTTRSPLTSKLRSQNNLVGMVDMLSFGFSNVECTHYDETCLDNSDASLLMRVGRSPSLVQAEAAVKVPADTVHGLAAVSIGLIHTPLTLGVNSKQVYDPLSQHPHVSSTEVAAPSRKPLGHRTSDSSTATAGSSDSCGACNSGCSLHSESGSSHDDNRNRNAKHNLLPSGSSSLDAYLTLLVDSDSSRELCVSWAQTQLHLSGCRAISSLLSATASVRVLSLTHCLITDNDVMELVPGLLLGPSCIAVLDLSHNMIGDSGIRELSLCLSKSSTLEMLHLSHNRIGDAGATVLASAARRCPSLSHLHLQGNSQVSATALKLIATSLSSAKRRRRNSTLGFYDLVPGRTSAGQVEVHEAGAIESSAAAMEFGTRSRFASVSCEREPETILQLLLRPTSPPELLVTGLVRQITRRGPACEVWQMEALGAHALAEQLNTRGVQASVKAARGSSNGGSCLRNLRHEYVTCDIPSTALGSTACLRESTVSGQVIVDPTFRDSFEISVMTPVYRKLLEQIPDVLVAAPHRLPLVVQFLCDRMHEAFLEHKVTVPPWREAASIMTKYGAATA